MAFFPDNRRAATAGADKRVHIWDLDTGREQAAWIGHDEKITGLAISADGSRIVTGSDDATVILWDVARGEIAPPFSYASQRHRRTRHLRFRWQHRGGRRRDGRVSG